MTVSLFGMTSCSRTIRARMPPEKKKIIELIRYRIPIFLWSVVVRYS